MAKRRRTSGVQRRERATADALNRRLDAPAARTLPDWRILAIGGVLLVGLAIIILVLIMGSPADPNAGTAVPDAGRAHVADGTTCRAPDAPCGDDPYTSVPATSGPHWGTTPVPWGAYAVAQNESQLVHNLEHGGIVIWYDPAVVTDDQVADLTAYVDGQVASGLGGRFKFITSPWGGDGDLGGAVAVTAWRHILTLGTFDMDAIRAFADANYLRYAPEPNGGPGPA